MKKIEVELVEDDDKARAVRSLWAEVLVRAVQDTRLTDALLVRDALRWLNDPYNSGVGSFMWVCDVLNVEPCKVLRNLPMINLNIWEKHHD